MTVMGTHTGISEKIDKYFLQALDKTALPAAFGTALRNNDKARALQIAADHFRKRPRPAFFAELEKEKFDPETALKAARGEVTVVGIPWIFPDGEIDFLYDPTRQKGSYNPEWQWQLNRMYFWRDMALAYLKDRDENISAAFSRQLRSWVTGYPLKENWNSAASAWRTIETGLRLMGSWPLAFEVFRSSPSVSDETLALMLGSMYEQALHALEHRTARNWLLMELNGVHTFAVLFPEFASSKKLRQESSALFCATVKSQILSDGMHNELSPDYQTVVFTCCSMLYNIAQIEGRLKDLPPEFAPYLEKLANAYLLLMTPGFTQPRTNDSFTIKTAPYLLKAHRFFPHRKDFLWAGTEGKQGTPPAGKTASRFLSRAGFAVMRSSWNEDAAYLCFDVGPLGEGHMHQDKLNINIYKGREELLYDDGGGQYERSVFRTHGISSFAHNVVLVDHLGQSRTTPRSVEKEIDARFFSDEKFDYARGVYDDTFGPEQLKSAVHTREVLFAKPDFFVVADTLQSADGNTHDYTLLLQMDTLKVDTSSREVRGVLKGEYDLYVLLLSDALETTASSGEKNPVSGWYVGRNDQTLHPSTTVKVTAKQKKDFRFLSLFFPLKKGEKPPRAEKSSDGRWQITFGEKITRLDLNDLTKNFTE